MAGALREAGEEATGLALSGLMEIGHQLRRNHLGLPVVNYLFAAYTLAQTELILSREHTAATWIPPDCLPNGSMPDRYTQPIAGHLPLLSGDIVNWVTAPPTR
jgi:hypothetical protein